MAVRNRDRMHAGKMIVDNPTAAHAQYVLSVIHVTGVFPFSRPGVVNPKVES